MKFSVNYISNVKKPSSSFMKELLENVMNTSKEELLFNSVVNKFPQSFKPYHCSNKGVLSYRMEDEDGFLGNEYNSIITCLLNNTEFHTIEISYYGGSGIIGIDYNPLFLFGIYDKKRGIAVSIWNNLLTEGYSFIENNFFDILKTVYKKVKSSIKK